MYPLSPPTLTLEIVRSDFNVLLVHLLMAIFVSARDISRNENQVLLRNLSHPEKISDDERNMVPVPTMTAN